jgi:hypothetical protein
MAAFSNKTVLLLLLLIGVNIVVAASSAWADEQLANVSCDERKTDLFANLCEDFTATGAGKGEKFMRDQCTTKGDVFDKKPCPTENVTGSCLITERVFYYRYYAGGKSTYTPEKAKSTCAKLGGAFIPAK